jgi:hypothetical protein
MIEVHALSEYGMQDNYKSTKDSSNLNKIKCINTNININGVNSGDVNVGNTGQLVQERYLSAKTFGQNGERYNSYDVYNKKDKGFDCIINNNNNNTNINLGVGRQKSDNTTRTTKRE